MDQEQLQTILTELRQNLEGIYGERLIQLILFGSQARGDAVPGSDIDVLVVLQGSVNPGQEIAQVIPTTAALSLQHDTVISCAFMDEDRFRHRNGPFLRNIRREGVVI